jgi:hypothetical protein
MYSATGFLNFWRVAGPFKKPYLDFSSQEMNLKRLRNKNTVSDGGRGGEGSNLFIPPQRKRSFSSGKVEPALTLFS